MDKNSLYEILEVSKKATQQQIKKSYREKANIYHPDKGGNKDTFVKIQIAYRVLSDKKKRKQYDETGTWSDKELFSETERAIQILAELYETIIVKADINEHTDLKKMIIEALKNNATKIEDNINKRETKITYLKNLLGKLPNKNKHKESLFDKVTRNTILKLENVIKPAKQELKIIKIAIAEMKQYDSVFESFRAMETVAAGMIRIVSTNSSHITTSSTN